MRIHPLAESFNVGTLKVQRYGDQGTPVDQPEKFRQVLTDFIDGI